MKLPGWLCLSLLIIFTVGCSDATVNNNIVEKPITSIAPIKATSTAPLSPEESMKTMRLPEGYKLELVASEPMVEEPVAIAWDGNGRLYVAEMRSYMKDIEGTDE
ncbi:MAG: cytochrome C, partial [Bacteroidetes bacterium]|nr:cytochrome C [Bacteroidota bacterium]